MIVACGQWICNPSHVCMHLRRRHLDGGLVGCWRMVESFKCPVRKQLVYELQRCFALIFQVCLPVDLHWNEMKTLTSTTLRAFWELFPKCDDRQKRGLTDWKCRKREIFSVKLVYSWVAIEATTALKVTWSSWLTENMASQFAITPLCLCMNNSSRLVTSGLCLRSGILLPGKRWATSSSCLSSSTWSLGFRLKVDKYAITGFTSPFLSGLLSRIPQYQE